MAVASAESRGSETGLAAGAQHGSGRHDDLPALWRHIRARLEILRRVRKGDVMTTTARFWLALSSTLLPAFAAVDGAVINRTTGKPQANVVVTDRKSVG